MAHTAFTFPIYLDAPALGTIWKRLHAWRAASLHVYNMECDHEDIPAPSVNLAKEDTEGNVIMLITIHPDLFRMKKDNERVKTNITLPAWLKRIAEEHCSFME